MKNNLNKDPVIETIKLAKVFKDFWHRDKVRAVDGLSLKIMPGEVFGLLGPNGSGKTTTLKLMLGLLFPTSGMVRIFGRSPRNVAVKTRIGFLPEESYFYRHLTASETMNFYGALFEIPGQERLNRGKKLLEMLGLGASLTRPVGEYSKGMMRRIGLAQALINDPDLIILDEPTSGLDPIGRKEVKNLIIELKKMGKTVLLSSHLLAEVQDVCDRICILYGGTKIAEGRVDEVLLKKNTAQVSFPAVSEEVTARIRDFAFQASGSADVKLSNPAESLEDFFLREIEKLQVEGKSRKAALEDKPLEKLSILQQLSAGEPRESQKEQKSPLEPALPEKNAGKVLENLVVDKSAAEAEKSERKMKIQREKDARKDDVFKKLLEEDRE